MLAKAPGWTSEMRLLVRFTDSSLGWVASTRGLSLSARKRFNDIAIKRHEEGGGLMISLPSGPLCTPSSGSVGIVTTLPANPPCLSVVHSLAALPKDGNGKNLKCP